MLRILIAYLRCLHPIMWRIKEMKEKEIIKVNEEEIKIQSTDVSLNNEEENPGIGYVIEIGTGGGA